MHWSIRAISLTAATLILSTGATFANGMRLASQDAFASSRGEAFVATADNPSAIYYNPAGITQIEGTEARGGIYTIYLDPTFEPPPGAPNSGQTYHIDRRYAAIPQFFLTHTPDDSKWSFGMGMYSPYGANVTWPQNTGFRSVAIEGDVKYFRFNPVVAYKILPQLSLAAGLLVDYSDLKLEQGLLANQSPFVNFFRFQGDGWTVGYNLGLLWQPHEMISFGVTYRSSTEITMDGKTEFQQQPIIPATSRHATADFEFPLTVVCGVSFRPTPKWNIEFNADYADWNSFDRVFIRQATTPPFPVQQNIPVNLAWKSSWNFELGATRYLENDWHLSAGYIYNQNSVPEAFYSPLAADVDRHFVALGAGHKGKRIDFDVTYQFGYGPSRTVTGSLPASQPGFFAGQSADGTYKFISHAIFVSVGMRF